MSFPALNIPSMQFLSFVAIIAFLLTYRLYSRKQKYLPGPRGLPIIGNLLQIPAYDTWETYAKWREIYGDAIYLHVLGSPIIVLNSYQACVDLLERRSSIYSDRPVGIMANQMMGWWQAVTMSPYTDRWRRYRKIMARFMRKGAVDQYHPIQEKEAQTYLSLLLKDPENFRDNFRLAAGRGIMKSIYGLDIQSSSDPSIAVAEEAMLIAAHAATPGNFLVDFFPLLRHIPGWFPGTGWKKIAEKGRILTERMVDIPFQKTKADMKVEHSESSFTSLLLDDKEDEDIVKWCSGTMYTAGIDTTVATISAFFLAMIRHPEVQRRAQADIDAICGGKRLPTLSDRQELPFIDCIVKEVIRWQPVSPIALPHRLIQDDIYQDCFLPAGATVLGNAWAITRDLSLYSDPDNFIPERFLPLFDKSIDRGSTELPLDPSAYGFGFGRRVCAGLNYADSMLFITVACILATFDISPPLDKDGNEVVPELKFGSTVIRQADPFECTIKPRSDDARLLVAKQSSD